MASDLTVDDIGLGETAASELSVEHARRVAAVLDAPDELVAGAPLPLLWHWTFFAPAVPTAELGPDGHPLLRPSGPTAGLPRRMWVGGRVHARAPLRLGEPATRRARIAKVERKSGRSGELVLVTSALEIEQAGRILLTEEQDLVYRAAADAPFAAPAGDERPGAPPEGWSVPTTVDSVLLFRFSAVTFNSHRIHYDETYARSEELYPALVVHGPLTALLLAESARRRGVRGSAFDFRASAPLFVEVPFTVLGAAGGGGASLQAVRNDGAVAMTARLTS